MSVDIKYLGIPNVCFSVTEPDDFREETFKQERIENGFDTSETWNLFITIAQFVLPRLIRFKEKKHVYPMELTENVWNRLLDEMILGFEYIAKDEIDEHYVAVQRALDLFKTYYLNLVD